MPIGNILQYSYYVCKPFWCWFPYLHHAGHIAMYGLRCLPYWQLFFFKLLIFVKNSQITLSNIFCHLREKKKKNNQTTTKQNQPTKPPQPHKQAQKKRSHHNFKNHKHLVDWHLEADDSGVYRTYVHLNVSPLRTNTKLSLLLQHERQNCIL